MMHVTPHAILVLIAFSYRTGLPIASVQLGSQGMGHSAQLLMLVRPAMVAVRTKQSAKKQRLEIECASAILGTLETD